MGNFDEKSTQASGHNYRVTARRNQRQEKLN